MKRWLLSLLAATGLFGHDSYLMPANFRVERGSSLLISIHNGDSFPASEHPTDPARLADIRLSDGSAVTGLQIMGRATHGVAKVSGHGSLYVAACLRPRRLELSGSKFEAYLQEEGLEDVIGARRQEHMTTNPGRELYTKCAKAYVVSGEPDEAYSTVIGQPIEFVPEKDPSSVSTGSSLPVRVIFRGKPLANVQVQMAWATGKRTGSAIAGRTDSHGTISIPISSEGKWRLHTVHMERVDTGGGVDWASYWASFTFEVEPGSGTKD